MQNTFKKNGITLFNGDSLEIIPTLKRHSFDACITDPPYNISGYDHKKKIGWLKSNSYWTEHKGFDVVDEEWDKFSNGDYDAFTEKWLTLVFDSVKPNGNILIFGTYHNIFLIGHLLRKFNKKIVNSIVWYKRNAFPNITQRMLCESTEYIIWAVNNDNKNAKNWTFDYHLLKEINHGKQMRNVWDIPYIFSKEEKTHGKHPTQKPVSVVERLVRGFTKKGDTIIDPFMGSGTIPTVCMANNRRCVGIDKSQKYFEVATHRVSEAYLKLDQSKD
jgi:DNA modification methylase